MHIRSYSRNSKPLLLLHGWPGTIYNFHKVIHISSSYSAIPSSTHTPTHTHKHRLLNLFPIHQTALLSKLLISLFLLFLVCATTTHIPPQLILYTHTHTHTHTHTRVWILWESGRTRRMGSAEVCCGICKVNATLKL